MEVMACAAWNIWKERNAFIFQGKQPSFGHWRVMFQHDLMIHQFRVETSFVQPLGVGFFPSLYNDLSFF
jgi:hypothetical protein